MGRIVDFLLNNIVFVIVVLGIITSILKRGNPGGNPGGSPGMPPFGGDGAPWTTDRRQREGGPVPSPRGTPVGTPPGRPAGAPAGSPYEPQPGRPAGAPARTREGMPSGMPADGSRRPLDGAPSGGQVRNPAGSPAGASDRPPAWIPQSGPVPAVSARTQPDKVSAPTSSRHTVPAPAANIIEDRSSPVYRPMLGDNPQRQAIQGMIWSEIFSKPRALRPYASERRRINE